MKKFKIAVLLVAITLCAAVLCGCGNKSFGVGGYRFNYIHIPQNDACFKVESWRDEELGIEVSTEYGWMFFSEGTYILAEGKDGCPICASLEAENGR